MTIYYYCFKGTLAHANCVSGSTSAVDNTVMATPRRTLAQFAAQFNAAQAGDQFLFAQGACWDEESTGQIKNGNSTAADPIIIGSYDASSVWSGGAGTKPIFINTTISTTFNFLKGTLTPSEGHTIQGLDIRGGGTNTWGLLGAGDMDHIIIQDCAFSGMPAAVQVNSATTSSATSDGITSHWTIRRNTFSNHAGVGCLVAGSHFYIEDNDFDHIGTNVFEHAIYVGGVIVQHLPVAIASLTGDGTTATLTTVSPHNVDASWHCTIGVSGSTARGSGTFNCTAGFPDYKNVVVTGPTTLTFLATGEPNASTLGAYTITRDIEIEDVVIRNNTTAEGHIGAAGQNNNAHIVFHGRTRNLLIENNTCSETVASANTSSVGIEIDTGSYSRPENYEGFDRVVVRNNKTINLGIGIALDIADTAIMENNYVYTDYTTGAAKGVIMRAKIGQAVLAEYVQPNKCILRNNTVHLKNAINGSYGMSIDAHVSDANTGSEYQMYNNLVVLETPGNVAVKAFSTANIALSQFTRKDFNRVVYTGGTVPKFENTSTLAAIQAGGDANKSDLNSTMVLSTSLTADQPFFTSPATSPAVGASYNGNSAGHGTLRPYLAYGGLVRLKLPTDIGAFEIGASTVVANSQTGLVVS